MSGEFTGSSTKPVNTVACVNAGGKKIIVNKTDQAANPKKYPLWEDKPVAPPETDAERKAREAKEKTEAEAQKKADDEAKKKADKEAKEKADKEAKDKAEADKKNSGGGSTGK